jgi:signal transduction histidine kinase
MRLAPLSGPGALQEAREALAAAQTRHHRILRKVAHDLRNPLNSILLMAQLLEEVGGAPETVRIAKRIQRQCEEMNSLVNQATEHLPG